MPTIYYFNYLYGFDPCGKSDEIFNHMHDWCGTFKQTKDKFYM